MDKLSQLIETRTLRAKSLMLTSRKQAEEEWYLVDCLVTLKNITECGDCNTCSISKNCQYTPEVGQMVRYNCPHYKKEGELNDTETSKDSR